MSLFSFRKPRPLLVVQEQGAEIVGGMKEVAVSTFAHIDALVRLLRLELQQYAALSGEATTPSKKKGGIRNIFK